MGHLERGGMPSSPSWMPELWRGRDRRGVPVPGVCPDRSVAFPGPCLPRQALSLLFDTYHNEVDAFLLGDVSTGPGPAQSSPSCPPVPGA